MKKLLFIPLLLIAAFTVSCQDIVFNMDQAGLAFKSTKTGRFSEAEVKDIKAIIVLQNNVVIVNDSAGCSYTLRNKESEKKTGNDIITQEWNAVDEKKLPVFFRFTVNVQSKAAMVEVIYKKLKNYYFGTYTTHEIISQKSAETEY